MDVLALLVRLAGVFWLDPECVCAEVITLCLQQVGGQVLCAVTVVEAQGGAESGGGDAPESTLGDNARKVSICTWIQCKLSLTLSIQTAPCEWPC